MKSPITKLAAAAIIIIAVLAGIYLITGRTPSVTCCAWAQIADRVAQIKTCVYWQHIDQSDIPTSDMEVDTKMYISSDYGYRMDTFVGGNIMQQMYMVNDTNAAVLVMPSQKKYIRMALNDERMPKIKTLDPRTFVTQFVFKIGGHQKDLGKDTINGVEVYGIEVNNPPPPGFQGVWNNPTFVGRMWVDVATEYPVRIEIEQELGTDADKRIMVQVFDGFEWGTELDPAIFEPNIPSDYTMTAEMKMPAQDEAGAVEGFRCFSEMTKGKYPNSIKTIMKEGMDIYTQSMQQSIQESIVKDMNIVPGAQLSEAMQPEIMSSQMKLQGPINFYNKLTQQGKEPVYYGKDVNAGDANLVLMSWKLSDDTYKVIYGDLTAENVTAEELKEMKEAAQQ